MRALDDLVRRGLVRYVGVSNWAAWQVPTALGIANRNPRRAPSLVVYLRSGCVMAHDCVNSVKDYVQGRPLAAAGAMIEPHLLADASQPLKPLPAS